MGFNSGFKGLIMYLQQKCYILCFADRASRFIRVMKTKLMHYLSSVYFVNQPLHVSDIFVAHHQEVYCIYTTILYVLCFSVDCLLAAARRRPTDSQLKSTTRTKLLYIYSLPPDDGLQICPKHVEVDWRNKLRINSASSWFSLHGSKESYLVLKFKTVCKTDCPHRE